jgi:ubiquinone/menaquinone biosynthesis C-methylase UbiE
MDFTPELMSITKEEASLAGTEDIECKEDNVENLPFEDETFDVMLSSFGRMCAPQLEIANGKLFQVLQKYIPIMLLLMIHRNNQYLYCNGEFLKEIFEHSKISI